jgi:hypothetical protein
MLKEALHVPFRPTIPLLSISLPIVHGFLIAFSVDIIPNLKTCQTNPKSQISIFSQKRNIQPFKSFKKLRLKPPTVPPNTSLFSRTLGSCYVLFLNSFLPSISQTYSKPTSTSLHASSSDVATLAVNPSFTSLKRALSRSI